MDYLGDLPRLECLALTDGFEEVGLDIAGSLTHLKRLQLYRSHGDLDQLSDLIALTRLTLSEYYTHVIQDEDFAYVDLSPLGSLPALKELHLEALHDLCDVDGLINLTSLKVLELACCSDLSNIDELSRLTALTTLKIIGCTDVQNLEPIRHLTDLRSLVIDDCEHVSSLHPLSSLTRLTHLSRINTSSSAGPLPPALAHLA